MNVTNLTFNEQLDLACDLLYSRCKESTQDQQYNFLRRYGFNDDLCIIAVEEFNS